VGYRGNLLANRPRHLSTDRSTSWRPISNCHDHLLTNCWTLRARRRPRNGRLGHERNPSCVELLNASHHWGAIMGLVDMVAHRNIIPTGSRPGLHRLTESDPVADRSARSCLGRCRGCHANRPTRRHLGGHRHYHLNIIRCGRSLLMELGFHQRIWHHHAPGRHCHDRCDHRHSGHPWHPERRPTGTRSTVEPTDCVQPTRYEENPTNYSHRPAPPENCHMVSHPHLLFTY